MTPTDYMEDRANHKWNATHPLEWPIPPRKMPRWYNFIKMARLREMEDVFGHIDQAALDRFWAESAKGQSVYEDAGGYMIRCYEGLMGFETVEPYTYPKAIDDLLAGREVGK